MSKLVIISHTRHYYSQNREIVGWEPTIREINYISKLFDSIKDFTIKIYHRISIVILW